MPMPQIFCSPCLPLSCAFGEHEFTLYIWLAACDETVSCPSAGSHEAGASWSVGVWVHSACTWLMSLAAVRSEGRYHRAAHQGRSGVKGRSLNDCPVAQTVAAQSAQ